MSDYVPPKVWKWEQPSGGQFANINRPVAGATRHLAVHDAVEESRRTLVPFDERRELATVHQGVPT